MVKDIKRKMSHEEFDKEFVEKKEQLNTLMELLQQDVEEQRYECNIKK